MSKKVKWLTDWLSKCEYLSTFIVDYKKICIQSLCTKQEFMNAANLELMWFVVKVWYTS